MTTLCCAQMWKEAEYFGKALHHTRAQLELMRSCVGAAGDSGLTCVCSLISFYLLGFGELWILPAGTRSFPFSCGSTVQFTFTMDSEVVSFLKVFWFFRKWALKVSFVQLKWGCMVFPAVLTLSEPILLRGETDRSLQRAQRSVQKLTG